MDISVSPADREFQDEARTWLAEHFVGEFRSAAGVGGPSDDRMWEVRLAWERELAAAKWLNVSWPVDYGGRGGTFIQDVIFQLEHVRAQAPYWVGVQGRDLLGPTLLEFGTAEQRSRFLPAITAAEQMWGQGFSEPDAGSDLASLRTRADLDGDEWVINGQKTWMTFGHKADWMYVLCRTDPVAPRHKGISMLLVPRDQPGIDVRPIRNIAGSGEFSEVFFSDARTRADLVVGEVNGGWKVVMGTLGNERGGTTVLPFQATFEREMEQLVDYVRDRGVDPGTRDRVLSALVGLRVLQAMNRRNVEGMITGTAPGAASSVSKLYWANWHRDFGELVMEVHGMAGSVLRGPGYDLAPYQGTFLTSRAETIYGGANEIQRNIVGEQVLGLPREPR